MTDNFTVPLVVIFTKFDGQIVNEYVNLNNTESIQDKWEKAKENAEDSFQRDYLPKVLDTKHPPKAYVRLQGRNQIPCLKVEILISYRYGYV